MACRRQPEGRSEATANVSPRRLHPPGDQDPAGTLWLEITSTQVSRAAAELDAMLEAWRNRPIPPISHLLLDARYEKVRASGLVRSCAVFTAIGKLKHDGKRTILGVAVSLSEAEVHWRDFLRSLQARGLLSCTSITSDAHEGLSEQWEQSKACLNPKLLA